MCSNAYFGVFRGGGHFWKVTPTSLIRVLHMARYNTVPMQQQHNGKSELRAHAQGVT